MKLLTKNVVIAVPGAVERFEKLIRQQKAQAANKNVRFRTQTPQPKPVKAQTKHRDCVV